jgi:hypothetical protein
VTGREDDEDNRIADDIHNELANYFQRSPDRAMVLKWTLQIEVIDASGENALWTLSMPKMAMWERQAFTRHALKYYDWVQQKANEEGEG